MQVREEYAVEVLCLQSMSGQLTDEALVGCHLELRPRGAPARARCRAGVDENALVLRLDDPRPHGERGGEARIPRDGQDEPQRPAMVGAALEKHRLEPERAGRDGGDAHGDDSAYVRML